ncbi:MAG: FKBP-type peptidyl-prolyl cis-trans isomerase [Chloroflexi bacterium]|nr:FKBP-type peptidyl-prolyl cis-trans isomerase [Chloroflexota bacterium]
MAKAGDKVSVHYTGTLDDGKQFDSSAGREPLQFTVGAGDVIAGFDRAVTDLEVGKSVKVRMEAKDAYGERRDDLVVTVPADQAPQGLAVGQRVSLGGRPATVTKVEPAGVTVDANHELAGQALNFEIQLVSIDS